MRMDRNQQHSHGHREHGHQHGHEHGHGHGHFAKAVFLRAAGKFGGWGGGPSGGNFGWDEDGAGRHGRGPRGRMFGSGELRLVLLKLIADQPGHGYQLIKAIEELTQGAYAPSPGVVYPTLSLLADEGAVQEIEGEGSRKAFAITEQGQAELTEKAAEVERIVARLTERAEGHRRGPPPQIARALGNLMMVLRQGKHDTAGEEHSVERHNAIVDILDDAAKRIERL
jgi:DNA-binding PadR family transcriptional regulator